MEDSRLFLKLCSAFNDKSILCRRGNPAVTLEMSCCGKQLFCFNSDGTRLEGSKQDEFVTKYLTNNTKTSLKLVFIFNISQITTIYSDKMEGKRESQSF